MNYNELKEHAEMCQMAADEMAFKFSDYMDKSKTLAIFQSKCDFNIFFIYSIAPEVVLHIESIFFMKKNIEKFKRKITLKEILRFDFIINLNKPNSFDEFIKFINNKT